MINNVYPLQISSRVRLTTEAEEAEYLKRVAIARERYEKTDRYFYESLTAEIDRDLSPHHTSR